ncbi:hypothetical protein ASPSYDRAFT_84629 [Aspergillus sydowii CBS 593.65]|uniref:Uncharacterized protein n=1 Tax=Aspergillus sydowii CBS 593.65 TaxID=1036612 RepID=A0A1L9TZ22_9EURO|nr:uncharacterized protein ASPSYDRAFT_84629 [Aspergillus sydowii CBS 593.65]OJJ64628.1 hypothetical protein ASPSYDRAFT_84629 [Aspergillus sydowii CBS 593.65]
MEAEVASVPEIDYNDALVQISTNLTNALNTYGSSSPQYQTVLEILKDHLRQIERTRNQVAQKLDPDTLSVAMGFLEIGK